MEPASLPSASLPRERGPAEDSRRVGTRSMDLSGSLPRLGSRVEGMARALGLACVAVDPCLGGKGFFMPARR